MTGRGTPRMTESRSNALNSVCSPTERGLRTEKESTEVSGLGLCATGEEVHPDVNPAARIVDVCDPIEGGFAEQIWELAADEIVDRISERHAFVDVVACPRPT